MKKEIEKLVNDALGQGTVYIGQGRWYSLENDQLVPLGTARPRHQKGIYKQGSYK